MARPFIDLVHPEDRERTEAESARVTAGDFTASFTNRYRTKDGRWRWIEWSSQVDPERRTIHAAARDVTDRLLAEQARLEAEERFHRAFEDSAIGMAVVGVEGAERELIMEANESLGRIFGCSHRELIGGRMLSDSIDPAHAPAVAHGMEELMRGAEAVHRNEYRVVRPDGTRIWLDLTASLVRDADGRARYRLVQVLDVTERKVAEDQLRFLADHDPLSGLHNRRRFEQELLRELDRGGQRQRRSIVLLLDVDAFKAINDTLGHATGDAVIARLGDTLRGRLRTGDVVARLGGDEFAVILRRTDVASAMEIAQDLRRLVAERLAPIVGEGHGPVTLSIGLAPVGGDETLGVDELLGRADRALYAAKRGGRDRVVVAGPADGASAAPLAQPIPAAVARLIGGA
jgi:diguanylate cyclase (GGDEF)-like protein/PAS domain S-box-containing protein